MTKTKAPRTINGVEVIHVEQIQSNLTRAGRKPVPLKLFRIHLADDTQLVGCGECRSPLDYTGTWKEVRDHRIAAHSYNKGGGGQTRVTMLARQRKAGRVDTVSAAAHLVAAVLDTEPAEPAEPVEEPVPAEIEEQPQESTEPVVPENVDAMTIGEIRRLAAKMVAIGDLVATLRIENGEQAAELKAANRRAELAEAANRRYVDGFLKMGLVVAEEAGLVDGAPMAVTS